MKVITAPEKYKFQAGDVRCFLAGGISNCPDWQSEVIKCLQDMEANGKNLDRLILFNPRRKNFKVGDSKEEEEQIEWEFNALNDCGIFSMYFCNADSDQPICMYELGRNLLNMKNQYWNSWDDRILVSVEDGYKRQKDVQIQTRLATRNNLIVMNGATPQKHAEYIAAAYENLFWQEV